MSSHQLIDTWGNYAPPMYAVHVTYLRALGSCCADFGCWKYRLGKRNIKLRIHREREDIDFLDGIYSPEEYHNFTHRLADALESRDCPSCPWICCGIYCLCSIPQRWAIEKALDDENRRLKDVGLQWNFHGFSNFDHKIYGLALTWLPQIRPHWELANPHLRRVALAPYPYYALEPFVQQDVNSMATNRLSVLGSSGRMNDPLVGTGGKILVNRWYWNESAFDPVKSGYPMGFDMNILAQFTPGQPPCFGQRMKSPDYSNQPPPTIIPTDEPHSGSTDVRINFHPLNMAPSMNLTGAGTSPVPPPSYHATTNRSVGMNSSHLHMHDSSRPLVESISTVYIQPNSSPQGQFHSHSEPAPKSERMEGEQ